MFYSVQAYCEQNSLIIEHTYYMEISACFCKDRHKIESGNGQLIRKIKGVKQMNIAADKAASERPERLFLILLYILLACGAAAGAVYLVFRFGSSQEVKDWIDSYMNGISSGVDKRLVFQNSVKTYAAAFALLLVCGLFRLGAVFAAADIVRRGFVTGFTAAAFIRFYGVKGIALMLASMTHMFIFLPALLIFASMSCALALKRVDKEKNFMLYYIIFSAVIFAIFCAAAICESFLTTIFMKWAGNSFT